MKTRLRGKSFSLFWIAAKVFRWSATHSSALGFTPKISPNLIMSLKLVSRSALVDNMDSGIQILTFWEIILSAGMARLLKESGQPVAKSGFTDMNTS